MKVSINKITIINIVSTFLLQGIAFISTPIFTRMLGTEQYGIYSLYYSWCLIMTCVMGLSISASIGTGYYSFHNKYIEFRNSVLLFYLSICITEIAILVVFVDEIGRFIGLNSGIVVLIIFTSFGRSMVFFGQTCYIYEKRAWSNFVLSVSVSAISVILSIVLILNSDTSLKYWGRLYGITVPYLLIGLIVWFSLYLKKPTGLKKEYCKYASVVGMPILFHTLSQLVLGQADRVMMQMFKLPLADIGIYSLYYTLSSVLSTILNALNNSWCPFYYDDVSDEKWDVLHDKCRHYIELFTVLGVGFLLLSREVSYLMGGKEYSISVNIIPILTFAVYFTFMYQFPVNFEFYHKKTIGIALGTIGAGGLNVILNALLIPLYGMFGAAIATAISYFALFLIHFFIVKNMKDYQYHLNFKVFLPGIGFMLIGTVAFYCLSSLWIIRWGLGIVLGIFELYRIYKRKSIF